LGRSFLITAGRRDSPRFRTTRFTYLICEPFLPFAVIPCRRITPQVDFCVLSPYFLSQISHFVSATHNVTSSNVPTLINQLPQRCFSQCNATCPPLSFSVANKPAKSEKTSAWGRVRLASSIPSSNSSCQAARPKSMFLASLCGLCGVRKRNPYTAMTDIQSVARSP